jgi:hypothetical protein
MLFLRFIVGICLLNRSAQGFGAPQWRSRVGASLSSSIETPSKQQGDIKVGVCHRTRWGVDKDLDEEYWFNSKIHSLGNTGFKGALHAALALVATSLIDNLAYDGVNVRQLVRLYYPQLIFRGTTVHTNSQSYLCYRLQPNWQQSLAMVSLVSWIFVVASDFRLGLCRTHFRTQRCLLAWTPRQK